MSLHTAYSWPYGDSETETRAFYHLLKAGHMAGDAFPFDRYQIALVRGSYTWFVAVLVLTDTAGDDSLYIYGRCEEWFKSLGGADYQDHESIPLRGSSIESSIGADYDILESFGTLGGGGSSRARAEVRSTVSSAPTAAVHAPEASTKTPARCPKCGAANFNLECSNCGHVDWGTVAAGGVGGALLLAAAIFWFQSFYWRIGSGSVGILCLLVPLVLGIKALTRRAGDGSPKKPVVHRGREHKAATRSAASGDGVSALASLFNNMSEDGAVNFAKMLNGATSDDVENLAHKLNTADEADVQAMAEELNAQGPGLKVRARGADPATKLLSTRVLEGHENDVKFLIFTADSHTLITASRGWKSKLILWNPSDATVHVSHDVGHWMEGLCISDDGRTLVIGGQSKQVEVFRLPVMERDIAFDPHGESISAIAVSPDGTMLATGVAYREMPPKLWSLPDGELLCTLPNSVQTRALQFSRDGRMLLCAAEREPVSIWSVPDGKLVKTLSEEVCDVYTNALNFNADGEILVTGDGCNAVRFVSFPAGQLLSKSKAYTFHHELAFSPDRELVAGSGDNGTAVVWSISDGRKLCELRGHTEIGLHLALSTEPRILVSSGTHMGSKKDLSVGIWSIPDGRPLAVLDDLQDPPHAVAISPDGRFVAIALEGGAIRLLELGVESAVETLPQPSPEPSPVGTGADATTAAASTASESSVGSAHLATETSELIRFKCPSCGKRVQAKPHLAGKRLRCPNKACGQVLNVPESDEAKTPVAARADSEDFRVLDEAYLARHDEAVASRVDAFLDEIADRGDDGIHLLVQRLYRDIQISGNRMVTPQWGDSAWNHWLQLAAVARAIGRAHSPVAQSELAPLVTDVENADPQFFEILQPALIQAAAGTGGAAAVPDLRDAIAEAPGGPAVVAVQPTIRKAAIRDPDVDRRDEDGATELYWAARKGDVASVLALVQRGADPNAPRLQQEHRGETPLHVAAADNRQEVVALLLEWDADVNVQDAIGNSPIQRAAVFGHVDVIKTLIGRGAEVNVRTFAGRTPLDWAVRNNHREAAELLRAHGGVKATPQDHF